MKNWNSIFIYNEDFDSKLQWRFSRFSGKGYKIEHVKAGTQAGYFNEYWDVNIDHMIYKCHRVIWEIFNGEIPEGFQVDHRDGDVTNNSIRNLRLVDAKGNARNQKMPVTNTSGVTGVHRTCNGSGRAYWTAQWKDVKQIRKHFSIDKFGDSEAFELAKAYRQSKIDELNARGAGYTTRHGTIQGENNEA